MAYRLSPHEPVSAGVRRLVREQLDGALDQLHGRTGDDGAAAVHDARKRLKKSRAVLRLARAELGDDVYHPASAGLRRAGRRLSAARDAQVLVDTFDDLGGRSLDGVVPAAYSRVRATLEERRREVAAEALEHGEEAQAAAEEIADVHAAISTWPLEREGFAPLRKGLRRAYERGRRDLAAARRHPTPDHLHEWRKRAKDLWYHARILEPAWPGGVGAIVAATDELGDLLGLDHDLALLREAIEEHGAAVVDATQVGALVAAVDERRAELERVAFAIGARVYADKPKAFVRRVERWFDAWRAEAAAAAGCEPAAAGDGLARAS